MFLRAEGQAVTGEPTALAHEPIAACVVLAGSRPRRLGPAEPWDAFDAKGFALTLVRALGGGEATVAATTAVPYLHPGVAAAISVGGRVIGCVGEVHPDVRAHVGIDAPVFIAEVDLSGFGEPGPIQMRPVPRFPASSRDVSLLLPEAVPAAEVERAIASVAEPLVERVALSEEYRDAAKLGADAKSQLWSITYRAADRTLTDAEIERAHEAIVARLTEALPAQRR
ncbi:MAG: hypothetical protein IPL61_11950 [Myxococcales bacterium]|nr:hypothetical protein [Myxococcales bacterium]